MKIQHELTVQSEATAALVHSQPSTDADDGTHTRTHPTSTGLAVLFYMDFFFKAYYLIWSGNLEKKNPYQFNQSLFIKDAWRAAVEVGLELR